MSVMEDFLVAFVAVHGDPSLRAAVVAALPHWSRSKGGLLQTIRDRGGLSAESIRDLEAIVRSRLAHFEGDAQRAFDGLFRSLFHQENLERSRQFFLALTGGESDRPRAGVVVHPTSRFRREKIHAMGGLGQVWLAQDPLLERRVALKEMRPELKNRPEYVRRFIREAKITGRLQHPSIVTVLEYCRNEGDENPCPFYAMRFVEGTTLSDEIRNFHEARKAGRFNRLDFSRLLDAFTDICRAIAYAHTQGILHRDLKPDNVMLGEFGEVVVLDWGLAKEIRRDDTVLTDADSDDDETEQTKAGQAIGTPGYMAPEQATGRRDAYSERTDVYGLGGILFAILSGEAPHERHPGENLNAMLQRIAEEPARNVRDVEPRASKTLSAICARAMARNPESRYFRAADLAADVERWEAGEPIPGFHESPWQQAARWIIRRQRTVTAIGGVLLIAFLAFVISRANASANLTVHIEQQLHDSRDAAQSFSQDLLRAAERISAETRFLGELGSVIQLIESQRSQDTASAERARLRVEQGLSAFIRRRRNAVRVALVSLVDKPVELVAFRRDQGRAVNDIGNEKNSFAGSAGRAAGSFQQLGSDLVYLDGVVAYVDPQRPPRQVWPRIRLVAPVAIGDPQIGGAIVLEVAYGLFNPILSPVTNDESQESELDWFLTNDQGEVLWSDPGRYSKLSELRAGASILNLIPELSPMFAAKANEDVRIANAPTIESVVFARPMQADYFYPPARFTIVAATPRSHLVEVAAQQQSTVVYAAIGVIVLGVGGGLLSIGILSGIARQSNRGYD